MNEQKLKYNELKIEREIRLKCQHNLCPLCLGKIKLEDANLDHDHNTGHIRAVLHPECNILLGKIENFLNRWSRGLKDDQRVRNFLDNLHAYMVASYDDNPLHPKHRTPTDKLRQKYERLHRRSKKPETKLKYKQQLLHLLEKLK